MKATAQQILENTPPPKKNKSTKTLQKNKSKIPGNTFGVFTDVLEFY